jgi:hypothetical protein
MGNFGSGLAAAKQKYLQVEKPQVKRKKSL